MARAALLKVSELIHKLPKPELGALLVFLDGTPTDFLTEIGEADWQLHYPHEQLIGDGTRTITGHRLRADPEEERCPASIEDETHCQHWWDGGPCCSCGAAAMTDEQMRAKGME